jgi:Kef-type K+ transport system membrane component KefB
MEFNFILSLALLLLLAKILGELAEKIGFPSLLGEVIAGIILGPQLLNMLGGTQFFQSLAEIGIIFLIFMAGFEHGSIKELLKYKNTSILISALGSSIPIIAVIFFSLSQGFNLITSFFLAVALGATSMGVSLRSLIGVGEIDSKIGKTVIGSLVLNDITGLILLTLVVSYAEISTGGGGNILLQVLKVIVYILLFFAILYTCFMYLPKLTTRFIKFRVEEAQFSLAIIIVLLLAWAATTFGLSSIIGAFFAGIILSRSPVFDNHSFLQKITSISYGLFVPVFFAYTGSLLDFQGFSVNIIRALTFLALITTVQIGCAFIAAKLNRYTTREGLITGIGMMPYGEVTLVVMSALIVLSKAKPEFFLGQDIMGLFASVLLLIMMSIILTPTLMKAVNFIFRKEAEAANRGEQ